MNGQMGPAILPQMSQASVARHPSREQLIDFLMLKVSQQSQGPPRIPHETLHKEVVTLYNIVTDALLNAVLMNQSF